MDVANDAQTALSRIEDHAYDLVLCDLMMPDVSGIDLYHIPVSSGWRALEPQEQRQPRSGRRAVKRAHACYVAGRARTLVPARKQPGRLDGPHPRGRRTLDAPSLNAVETYREQHAAAGTLLPRMR